jgi:predicted ATP-grasp superfamily ATP-dependent carboligase
MEKYVVNIDVAAPDLLPKIEKITDLLIEVSQLLKEVSGYELVLEDVSEPNQSCS